LLARLIATIAEPVIHGIVRHKLHVSLRSSDWSMQNQDALDLASGVQALVIAELQNLKMNREQRSIGDFRQYVAIKTYSACADYFRKKHPNRWRLKNALRYQLRNNRQFTLREDHTGKWICGLSVWPVKDSKPQSSFRQPADYRSLFPEGTASLQGIPLVELLSKIFEKAGHPLELDQLVANVAGVRGIKDYPVESFDQDRVLSERLANSDTVVDVALEQQLYLSKLWEQVCSLPPLQRAALLLNLRDVNSDSVIAFLPFLGIASQNEIAELVGLPQERFAELWDELPLEDAAIAQLLGITRQQVINLRKTARERLARRMKTLEKRSLQTVGK